MKWNRVVFAFCFFLSSTCTLLVSSAPVGGMVLIPGGTNSGTNPLADGESHSEVYPASYNLTVDSFYMDKYLVTKELWDEVYDWAVADGGYSFDNEGEGQGHDHPVHSVNWYDAVKWCNARSEMEGRTPAYYTSSDKTKANIYRTGQENIEDGWVRWDTGYRLPTMDEWEYAARGGLGSRRFPWGDRIDHSKANYNARGETYDYDDGPEGEYHPKGLETESRPYTTPVDYFESNNYGLHDMAGNLWEWNYDWYLSLVGSIRVLRGGCWLGGTDYCRVGYRISGWPGYADFIDLGFRAVLPPDPASAP